MEEYGSAGLRTLCLAWAELDPAEYDKWVVQADLAGLALAWAGPGRAELVISGLLMLPP
jgi:hypothetical protein